MRTRVLVLMMLASTGIPALADTIITRTGAATGSLTGVTSIAVSWTQAAGTTFSAASISVTVHSTNGAAATATAYLTNALGSGATVANQLAIAPISVSASSATSVAIPFPAVSLPPGTYYVVLSNASPNFGWDFVGGGATEALGAGVSSNTDRADLATPTPAFPPSSGTFVTVSAGGSNRVFLFSAIGTTGAAPTGVPTLGVWGTLGAILLLGACGVRLMQHGTQE